VTVVRYFPALLLGVGLTAVTGLADDEAFQPDKVVQCLKSPKAAGLTVLTSENPFYLRGDFDADGKPDYALRVRSKNGGTGVLICAGSGSLFLLGARLSGAQFSDMPQDKFLAPQWAVYTKQEAAALGSFQNNVPRPVPSVKGEAIAMIWEDGISLIYWDGAKFKWAGSKE
jgi:hypothetical protein